MIITSLENIVPQRIIIDIIVNWKYNSNLLHTFRQLSLTWCNTLRYQVLYLHPLNIFYPYIYKFYAFRVMTVSDFEWTAPSPPHKPSQVFEWLTPNWWLCFLEASGLFLRKCTTGIVLGEFKELSSGSVLSAWY